MNRPTVLTPLGRAIGVPRTRSTSSRTLEQARLEATQRRGKALVVAGWISAVIGVVLYCVASFGAGADADLAAIVLHGAVPAARAALVIVAGGTLLWIVGSVMHMTALLDAADLDARRRAGGGRDDGAV